VRISGVRGEPAPDHVKVCINYMGGLRNSMTFILTGLDIEAKADLSKRTLLAMLGGAEQFDSLDFDLIRSDKRDAPTNAEASAQLRVTAKGQDPAKVGRAFSNAVVEMVLSSFPGFYCTSPPAEATPYGVYWPTLIPSELVDQQVVLADGTRIAVPPTPGVKQPGVAELAIASSKSLSPKPAAGPTRTLPLGAIIGARSGDKGGNANVGVWARSAAGYEWLASLLSTEKFLELVPEAQGMAIRRYEFPKLWSLNFVVVGLLGEGVSSSTRPDAQAKSLGEYLRSRLVEIPEALLVDAPY
jgi:hypothetical protein